MLVLTRKPGEKVVLDNNIVVTVIKVEGNQVRLGFAAPDQVRIVRAELLETARREAPRADTNDADLLDKPEEWLEAAASRVIHR